jgi:hypothetical protein
MNIYSPHLDEVFESLKTMNFNISDYHNLPFAGGTVTSGFSQPEDTKKKISNSLKGNTNKTGKTGYKLSQEFKEKCRNRLLTKSNPMSNPESVDKIRQKSFVKFKCPHCDMQMNKGNLTKHIKAKH